MKSQIQLVESFHHKYQGLIAKSPTFLTNERSEFRHRLMLEEVEEYLLATKAESKEEIAKELADILYTVYGTIIEHGLQDKIEDIFLEVHSSNMSKDLGEFKAIKGKNYRPPNLKKFNLS